MAEREVKAGPFKVCEDCPAGGTFSDVENRRKCYGRKLEAIGAAACGKKIVPTSAVELFPELFKNDD